MQEDYLAHYGVKGMKWGVHNAETAARYGESGPTRKLSKKKAAVATAALVGAATLAAVNPTAYAVGAVAVSNVVGVAAPVVARKAVYSVGNYLGTKTINKAAQKALPKAKTTKARKLLRELSEETITEVAIEHGKKILGDLIFE